MERIECPCRPQIVEPVKFDVGDSIKIIYSFRNLNYYPEYLIPLKRVNFTIKFYIKGKSEEFLIKKVGSDLTNCKLGDRSDVICLLKDHGLGSGKLVSEIRLTWGDEDFSDGVNVENYLHDLNIILTDNGK